MIASLEKNPTCLWRFFEVLGKKLFLKQKIHVFYPECFYLGSQHCLQDLQSFLPAAEVGAMELGGSAVAGSGMCCSGLRCAEQDYPYPPKGSVVETPK